MFVRRMGFLAPAPRNKRQERSRLFRHRTPSLVALILLAIGLRPSSASTSSTTVSFIMRLLPAPAAVPRWRESWDSRSALPLGKGSVLFQPRSGSFGHDQPRRRSPLSGSGVALRFKGGWGPRHRVGGCGRCTSPLWTTTTALSSVAGTSGDSAEDPAEGPLSPSGDPMNVGAVTLLTEDKVADEPVASSSDPVEPRNDALVPSCDPKLVNDILEVVGGTISIPAEFQDAVSAGDVQVILYPTTFPAAPEREGPTANVGYEVAFDDIPGETRSPITDSNDAAAVASVEETNLTAEQSSIGEKSSLAMVPELVAFTLPLLVVWLSNPVMSLVDTAVVGAQSSVELAALGPATSLCDNIAYMCGFLAQVTTNLCASAFASGDSLKAERATRTGLFVSAGVGVVVTSILLTRGRALLQFVLGSNPAVSHVLPFSCSYVYIRALGFVAVTMTMVLQGTFLARKDVVTPIKTVAAASVVNLVLDCVAVFVLGMGIKGAALSTTVAQWAALGFLISQFWPDLKKSGKVSLFPYRKELFQFLSLGIPMCLALSGQVATCISITVAASGCDTVALAAHQVIYGVFLLFCPIGEALSETVQTFLPAYTVERPIKPGGKPSSTLTYGKTAVRMMKVICVVALGLGVVDGGLAALLTTRLPSVFSPDKAVWAAMRSVAPMCGLSLVLHGVTLAFQGAMMATREVLPTAAIYSVGSMVFTTSIVLLRRSTALTLPMVWRTFVFYQIARCVTFASTVGWSHRASLMEHFFTKRGEGIEVERLGAGDQSTMSEDEEKEGADTGIPVMPQSPSTPARGGVALAMTQGGDISCCSPGVSRLRMWPRISRARQGVAGLLRRKKQD